MKLKIVYGYILVDGNVGKIKDIRKELIGQTFTSFNKVWAALKLNEHVTVEDIGTGNGYKEVWKDKEGEWVQRRWVFEY